jgi:ABC-type transport system involved in multi-copper enzyme maturation permease subunit
VKYLAIIGRELTISGKSWKTYFLRMLPTLLTLALLGAITLAGNFYEVMKDGKFLFFATLGISALYAGASGYFASSALSREREEDTLGLLFLTPLKSPDIILGKFFSAVQLHLQTILTLLPLQAAAFLMGGISLDAFFAMNAFIFCWLCFSTGGGIFISSFCSTQRTSSALSIVFIAFVTFGISVLIPLTGFTLQNQGVLSQEESVNLIKTLFPFTPGGIFFVMIAFFSAPRTPEDLLWMFQLCKWGLLFLLLLSTLFLCGAGSITSRVWRKQPPPRKRILRNRIRLFFQNINLGSLARRTLLRLRFSNPYDWVNSRDRFPTLSLWMLWFGSILPVAYLLHLSLEPLTVFLELLTSLIPSAAILAPSLIAAPLCVISCVVLKIWTAYLVTVRIRRDISTQMLPLILMSRFSPRQIILSHVKNIFKRAWPLILFTFGIVAYYAITQAAKAVPPPSYSNFPIPELTPFTVAYIPVAYGVIILLADILTLSLVAIRFSLRAKNIQYAFLRTVSLVLGTPWIIAYLVFIFWYKTTDTLTQAFDLGQKPWLLVIITLAALLYDLALCVYAWRSSLKQMRSRDFLA